ncbi:MliC family protein [Aromatoleum aromaticum]|uniref:MliC family protein n=1 Tax=Aromatoleum aromaticum TaxID=551760 RepID=UPI001459AA89|nr:MliC family protein [Aromatoleum aromaticum]NMG54045.1 hypothetical protein [Aromatoleum aromaticum]
MTNLPRPGAANLKIRVALLVALTGATGMLASTAYTRDASRIVGYACPSGERFTVEYLRDHIRLRTGAGVFALAVQPAASGEKYSDGHMVFHLEGAEAQLERPGWTTSVDCRAQNQRL